MSAVLSRRPRRLKTSIAALVLGGIVVSTPTTPAWAEPHRATAPAMSPRTAKPTPTVASVTAELDRLARRAEQLAEQYNRAVIQARSARAAATTVRREQAVAARRAALARQSFVAMVVTQYESGQSGSTGALLTSSNPQDYLDRLSTLDMMARQRASVVTNLQTARRAAAVASRRADTALAHAQDRTRAIKASRTSVMHQTATLKALRGRLTAAQQRAYSTRQSANPQQRASVSSVHAGNAAAQRAVNFALAQVGKPYVFGAAGPGSYDCSGLTMAAWARGGVNLPHLAADQIDYGTRVGADQLQPGDLVFLYQPIGHVSMYIGHGMLVSAPQPGENVKIVPFAYFRSDFAGGTRLA